MIRENFQEFCSAEGKLTRRLLSPTRDRELHSSTKEQASQYKTLMVKKVVLASVGGCQSILLCHLRGAVAQWLEHGRSLSGMIGYLAIDSHRNMCISSNYNMAECFPE